MYYTRSDNIVYVIYARVLWQYNHRQLRNIVSRYVQACSSIYIIDICNRRHVEDAKRIELWCSMVYQ